jgi:hypothetical protein
LKTKHGGKRSGAGKPKGVKWPSTLAKEAARELTRQKITAALEPMIEAQVAHAIGLKYLVARHKTTGKFAKLTEELATAITEGTNPDYETIEVWAKDPSVQAFTDLMNRAIDKPAEQEQAVAVSGELVISWKKSVSPNV